MLLTIIVPAALLLLLRGLVVMLLWARSENAIFDRDFMYALQQSNNTCVGFVLAHPDDESMFMTPFLDYLSEKSTAIPNFRLHMLTLSSGNANGEGEQRKAELADLCEKYNITCMVIEDKHLQDGPRPWIERIAVQHIQEFIDATGCRFLVTFDEHGASKHPNHISTHHSMKAVKALRPDLVMWKLMSHELLAKYCPYIGLMNALYRGCRTITRYSPFKLLRNMFIHRSQLKWHVFLWSFFSVHAYTNTFSYM